jgi:hypothetical protein
MGLSQGKPDKKAFNEDLDRNINDTFTIERTYTIWGVKCHLVNYPSAHVASIDCETCLTKLNFLEPYEPETIFKSVLDAFEQAEIALPKVIYLHKYLDRSNLYLCLNEVNDTISITNKFIQLMKIFYKSVKFTRDFEYKIIKKAEIDYQVDHMAALSQFVDNGPKPAKNSTTHDSDSENETNQKAFDLIDSMNRETIRLKKEKLGVDKVIDIFPSPPVKKVKKYGQFIPQKPQQHYPQNNLFRRMDKKPVQEVLAPKLSGADVDFLTKEFKIVSTKRQHLEGFFYELYDYIDDSEDFISLFLIGFPMKIYESDIEKFFEKDHIGIKEVIVNSTEENSIARVVLLNNKETQAFIAKNTRNYFVINKRKIMFLFINPFTRPNPEDLYKHFQIHVTASTNILANIEEIGKVLTQAFGEFLEVKIIDETNFIITFFSIISVTLCQEMGELEHKGVIFRFKLAEKPVSIEGQDYTMLSSYVDIPERPCKPYLSGSSYIPTIKTLFENKQLWCMYTLTNTRTGATTQVADYIRSYRPNKDIIDLRNDNIQNSQSGLPYNKKSYSSGRLTDISPIKSNPNKSTFLDDSSDLPSIVELSSTIDKPSRIKKRNDGMAEFISPKKKLDFDPLLSFDSKYIILTLGNYDELLNDYHSKMNKFNDFICKKRPREKSVIKKEKRVKGDSKVPNEGEVRDCVLEFNGGGDSSLYIDL